MRHEQSQSVGFTSLPPQSQLYILRADFWGAGVFDDGLKFTRDTLGASHDVHGSAEKPNYSCHNKYLPATRYYTLLLPCTTNVINGLLRWFINLTSSSLVLPSFAFQRASSRSAIASFKWLFVLRGGLLQSSFLLLVVPGLAWKGFSTVSNLPTNPGRTWLIRFIFAFISSFQVNRCNDEIVLCVSPTTSIVVNARHQLKVCISIIPRLMGWRHASDWDNLRMHTH